MLAVIGVVIPVAVAVHYGAMGAPGADDWAYDLSAFHLAFHGGLNLYGWGPSNMVGQLVLAAPFLWIFGAHIWALNLWTCVVGTCGLLGLDVLGRQLGLSRRKALLAAALVGLGPMWAALSTSYMLDVPAVALMTVALALVASEQRTDRLLTPRSLAALVAAGLAFSIRDEAIIAVVAVCWGRLWRCGRPTWRSASGWLAASGSVGLALILFQLWRWGLTTGGHGYPVDPPSQQLASDQWLLPLAGLMLLPAAIVVGPIRTVRNAYAALGKWLIVAWATMPGLVVIDYLGRASAAPVPYPGRFGRLLALTPSFGDAYFLPGSWGSPALRPYILGLLLPLALLSLGAFLVAEAAGLTALQRWVMSLRDGTGTPDHSRHVAVLLGVVTAGSWVIFGIGIVWGLEAWDRYLFPLVAYVPMLMVYVTGTEGAPGGRPIPRFRRHAAGVSLAALAALSLMAAFAYDGATGSNWRYSNRFAASHPSTPATLIYTYWIWTSMQARRMVDLDPTYNMVEGYHPCYYEQVVPGRRAPDPSFQPGGSWVEPLLYSIRPEPDAKAREQCRL